MNNLFQNLNLLLNPCDLILIAILFANIILGCSRGLIRTLFGLFGKLAAIAFSASASHALAPLLAQHFISPIIGDVLQSQVTTALQNANIDGGTSFLRSISQTLVHLLDFDIVKTAAMPLQEAIAQATQSLSNSIAYAILFVILAIVFSILIHIMGEALHFLTEAAPLKAIDRLGGALFGALCGAAICITILWVLHQFAPALFTELGILSPTQLENSLLTRTIVELFR